MHSQIDPSKIREVPPERKPLFWAELAFYLSQAARAAYTEAGNTVDIAAKQLHAYNEMTIAVASQIVGVLGASETLRPDDALVSTLEHWAAQGQCQQGLAWAFDRAFGSE